ncbi:acyl-homoserine-lactone synthase [Bradyrhizobium elkanii]|jgi:acyl homoserine lactone synthase|uniref:acyl-homoserine-lactone synthase n=1 Tax=Bradyrhizobium elkanii TaxID=29448 RepID=A0A8I2CBW9_BRAEL|nr:acyl-homoserine-lactone synthase [Bradyrhizobium elkanii]MBP1299931.1 acyl homoserine lactone synthase [Bradyrhizobium elkanii]MCP1975410.1 acyl homoserine lactone synthase [Bradyrhizobium elkanii]MCS3482480.1 acyl homoserine lactone synthase [Bradyrhizobium elkanii]MCS3525141.1 acyl homoserine lactone synthase [Bradyrhizobium elkanii]MCS4075956.1 acyl homoserine lactone synthase [Bradyrhizobium elkanii]
MKVTVRTHAALLHDSELAMGMHRLRGRVFKERLDWDVSVRDGLEIDQYDTLKPTYLLALEKSDVVGCVRLLPTTGRNMLADTFPVLLDGNPAPRAARIWESSRFCVDTKSAAATAENGLRKATFLLFAAMIEWGQQHDLQAIATVTDLRMERILRRAGWHLDRLGTPRQIGTTNAVAGLLPISEEALGAIRAAGQISGRAIDAPSNLAIAA